MRRFLGLCLAGAALLAASASLSGCCGNAEANPCRWNMDKAVLPQEVTEASRHSARNLVILDFSAEGEEKAAFRRDYDLVPGQTEIEIGDLPEDDVYTVKGSLYSGDDCEPAVVFDLD